LGHRAGFPIGAGQGQNHGDLRAIAAVTASRVVVWSKGIGRFPLARLVDGAGGGQPPVGRLAGTRPFPYQFHTSGEPVRRLDTALPRRT
jgi:hypothetical protein